MSITEIKQDKNKVTLSFAPENPLSGYALANAAEKYGPKLFIHGGQQPFIRLTVDEKKNLDETLYLLDTLAENRKTLKAN